MSKNEIRYLIIDDDLVSATLLRKYLKVYENLHFTGFIDNTSRALNILKNESVDLIFLDIEMPGDDGIQFLKKLELEVMIIFVTSKSKYALTAFDFNPIHFLTKPLDREKLGEAIRRVHARVQLLERQDSNTGFLIIKNKSQSVKIPYHDISLVEAAADYMFVHTSVKTYIFHITMKELLTQLPTDRFKRVHRSYIVNKNFVTKIDKSQLLVNGKEVPVGPKFKIAVEDIFSI
ncbi:LytR/AlgR family response regulator transcription factor [Mongoliitalea daihaiensis]|uniref:LytR/AlgR family response regulator transcription factor n=1 Tax=Mongoliitalea daihaiensis TaxID=2782006 RepID=UPI001F3FE967|nr:LytTR family DNA-binding domain-containing protein [Mongoliitalea daihaiensis]UJP64522.1 response regulator transcription factor [Mongoliitalea daihaiensis]